MTDDSPASHVRNWLPVEGRSDHPVEQFGGAIQPSRMFEVTDRAIEQSHRDPYVSAIAGR